MRSANTVVIALFAIAAALLVAKPLFPAYAPTGMLTDVNAGAIAPGSPVTISIVEQNMSIISVKVQTLQFVSGVRLLVKKVLAPPLALERAYQYIDINATNLPSDAIDIITIRFSVDKGWLTENNIDPDTVRMNRLESGAWMPIATAKIGESQSAFLYETSVKSLSIYAISGNLYVPRCIGPAPQPTEWSACSSPDPTLVAGRQNRFEYICGPETEYAWMPRAAERVCCPPCPESQGWSACLDGAQQRIGFACSEATGYVCVTEIERRACEAAQAQLPMDTIAAVVLAAFIITVAYVVLRRPGQLVFEIPPPGAKEAVKYKQQAAHLLARIRKLRERKPHGDARLHLDMAEHHAKSGSVVLAKAHVDLAEEKMKRK